MVVVVPGSVAGNTLSGVGRVETAKVCAGRRRLVGVRPEAETDWRWIWAARQALALARELELEQGLSAVPECLSRGAWP